MSVVSEGVLVVNLMTMSLYRYMSVVSGPVPK